MHNSVAIRSVPKQWLEPSELGSMSHTLFDDVPSALGVIKIFFIVLNDGFSQQSLHSHDRHEMWLPVSGGFNFEFDDSYKVIDAQHPVYMPPGMNHRLANICSPAPCLTFLLRWEKALNEAPYLGKVISRFSLGRRGQDSESTLEEVVDSVTIPMATGSLIVRSITSAKTVSVSSHEAVSDSTIVLLKNGQFNLMGRKIPSLGVATCEKDVPLKVDPLNTKPVHYLELLHKPDSNVLRKDRAK